MASMMIVLPTKTEALDMMIPFEDPFKILEQIPFNLAYKSLDTTIDLARADWKETSMHHVISIDVPGIKRGDIKVEVEENRVLKVSGEKKADEETNGDKWHTAERTCGKFCRQFKLPVNANMENITAQLEDGVLKISVTKMAHERKQSQVIDIIEQGRSSDDVKTTKATA
ncbi:HSP20-like chaperones superfamily protein [Tanacetum coccineum]|uniref:HSP20-like chaperones superfamily protein n=1 Tax=Tanacetum coccineum TaxID=301880 RepID=A0ABQ5A780_9ASTR